MKRILCIILCAAMLLSCTGPYASAEEEAVKVIPSIAEYHVYGEVLADDGYLGIPVEVNTYVKEQTAVEKPVVLYVMNTNTERIGTESDDTILADLLEDGFIVVVLDYKNHPLSVSPGLDWSIQAIRNEIEQKDAFLNGNANKRYCSYVLPAGYRIEINIPYWNIADHGSEGCKDYIVDAWNDGVKTQKGNVTITYPDGTTKRAKDITATTIEDCVKPDGTPIEMNLFLDIIYPSQPENEVPVMLLASSAETRPDSWSDPLRPHLTGYLFSGYAGVIYDHAYVPMARNDHYGYFEGVENINAFTLVSYTGVKANTAAVRCIRHLADSEPEKYKFNKDKFGAYGHSKGAWVYLLGMSHPELEDEDSDFEGYQNEPDKEQPWLTYQDGTPIPSNVQMVYMSHGGGRRMTNEGMAPTFISVGEADGDGVRDFLPNIVSNSRFYDVPAMYFTMPGVGHTIIYGYSEKYDVDMYQALFDFSHYYLKDDNAVCEYITPLDGTVDVDVKDEITLKFTGPVPRSEIEGKVSVKNLATGETAAGVWEPDLGNTAWTFTAHNLKGGSKYQILVPQNVTAENGKPLREAKSAVIKTKYESAAGASGVYSDAGDMTLTKTEDTDNGVYFVFEAQDFANSTTTALRFSVENEAANHVLVYGIDALNEADVTQSTVGDLLGEVKLTGKGDYEIDVTEYVGALGTGEKAAFLLKAEKNIGTNVVTDVDFETADSRIPAKTVSSDFNNTEGGSKSYKSTMFERREFIVGEGRYISKEDLGRRFHISFDLLLPVSRRVTAKVRHFAASGSNYADLHDGTYQLLHPEAGVWNRVEMDYVIDDPSYCEVGKDALSIRKEGSTYKGGAEYLYVDNLKVTEDITEVRIASAATSASYAPSLVLHPSEKKEIAAADAAYVENGTSSDMSFSGSDGLLVNGRWLGASTGSYQKVYARIALEDYSGMQPAEVQFKVTEESHGEIYVYGVTDPDAAAHWDADTINYTNAPANNRFGFDADAQKVYGGAPIAVLEVGGAGSYTVDVTDYAAYMKDIGAQSGTLIFVMNTPSRPETQVLTEGFEGSSVPFEIVQGGDIIGHGISANESHSGTSSYQMNTAYNYDRLKFDILDCKSLTVDDVGKRYTVTYWMKSDKTGSFFNSLLFQRGANEHVQKQTQNYTVANEWQQFTYSFTLTSDMINENSTPETIPSYLNFQLDGMGLRASGKYDNVCVYIDDLTVTENKAGDIPLEFVPAGGETVETYQKTISFDDLATWRTSGSARTEVNDEFDMGFGGGVQANLKGELVGADVTADHTTGTGKSLWLCMPDSWNRFKFYNFFDHNLTEADVGRSFHISFWAKTDKPGSFEYGFMSVGGDSSYTAAIYESELNKKQVGQVTEADTWTQFEYDVTIDEGMLASYYTGHENEFFNPALFSIVSSGLYGRNMYVDDFVITETTEGRAPYAYRFDWESEPAETAWSFNGFENGDSKVLPTTAENHTPGAADGKSLQVLTDKTYNRVYFYNIIDQMTAADIGRTFQVAFWMKADKAGRFQLVMSNKEIAGAEYDGEIRKGYTIADSDVGVWKKYTFAFTVDESMVANGANLLSMYLPGFGQKSDGSVSATLYIDDLFSMEYTEGDAAALNVESAAVISNTPLDSADSLRIGRSDTAQGIHKTYLRFSGDDSFKTTQRAALELDVQKASGQTVRIYGLTGVPYPEKLTYNTAPASNEDESMDESKVYGGAPLAELAVNAAGRYTIDVTDYVKNTAPEEYIFAITSESTGGTEYLNLGFDDFPFSKGVDYTAFGGYEGTAEVADGKAGVRADAAGEGIKLLNVFGNGGTSCQAGRTYTVSVDVSSTDTAADVSLGLCTANNDTLVPPDSVAQSIAPGERKTLTLTYTADNQDETSGVSALAVYSVNGAGFEIDNVRITSDDSAIITPSVVLAVETAKESDQPEEPVVDLSRLTVNANGGGAITYGKGTPSEQDWGTGKTADFARGEEIALTAVADEGSRFVYWVDKASGRVVSEQETYTFTLGTAKSLEAFFISTAPGSKTAIFKNKNGKILQSNQIGADGSVTVPENPEYMGYVFDKWIKNGIDQKIAANDTLPYDVLSPEENLFTAHYRQAPETYAVTVVGGTLAPGVVRGEYAYDTLVTVTLDESAIPAGQKFSHWTKDGQTISYERVYSFYMSAAPVDIAAVYVPETETVVPKPVLVMTTPVLLTGQGKIAFFAERQLGKNNAMIETGILLSRSGPDFDLDTPDIIKSASISTSNVGQYTVRVRANDGDTWYAKAYMLYKDENGDVKCIYSDTTEATYME